MNKTTISVRQHGKGWQFYFRIAGGKKVSKCGFASEKEAFKAGVIAQENYLNNGRKVNTKTLSVSQFLNEWLENKYQTEIELSTYESYKKLIKNHINPRIGDLYLQTVDNLILQNILDKMSIKGYKNGVIVEVSGVLTSAFRDAFSLYKYITNNPAENLKIPKKANKGKSKKTTQRTNDWISKEDMEAIFERFPKGHQYYIPLILGYRCGLRRGEIFGVTWQDINFKKSTLTVNRQMQYSTEHGWYVCPPKYNEIRTIYLDPKTLETLKEEKVKQDKFKKSHPQYTKTYEKNINGIRELNNFGGKELDFINRRSDHSFLTAGTVQHMSHVIHDELMIDNYTTHSLRHTHISDLVAANIPITEIVSRTGHKNIKEILDTYLHNTSTTKSKMSNIIDNLY